MAAYSWPCSTIFDRVGLDKCEGLMGLWKMVNAGNVETGVVVANGASAGATIKIEQFGSI